MNKRPKIRSAFALLDVESGRKSLLKVVGFAGLSDGEPIPVVITGRIMGAFGHDDGVSQEFEVEVTKVELS